jgi:rod shape-determining protein MreC
VITSGGDRIFPKGLPVGKVVSVEPGKDLFLNIRVVPSARLDQVEEVLVVTKITERMPDTKDLGPLRASDILAERLPTVPNKAEVDAAGNAKPGSGTASPTTTPAAAANGTGAAARPGATPNKPSTGTSTPTKPATGVNTANKPAGATAPHPSAAGTTGTVKPKPAGTTRPEATGASDAGTAPSNGVRIVNNDDTAPPKKTTPPAQPPPAEQQPATPATGEPPPQ